MLSIEGDRALEAVRRPSSLVRLFGLGSVFGKTVRDSRIPVLGVGFVLGLIVVATGVTLTSQFATGAERAAIAAQMGAMPAMFRGLLGEPINIETLPGFLSWRAIGFMPVMIGLWAVTAFAGTLAGEASKGTLELALSAPISRISLALQKLGAHLGGMAVMVLILTVLTWMTGVLFGSLPGDDVDPFAAFSEFLGVVLLGLLFAAITFAVAPLLGRTLAAGVGGVALIGTYVVNGYSSLVPGFDVLRVISPFYWVTGHRPLAGRYDWPPIVLIAALCAVLFAIGVWLFERRDLASTVNIGGEAGMAGARGRVRGLGAVARVFGALSVGSWSLGGPGLRSFAERLPAAIGWGALMGIYGFVIAISADEFAKSLGQVPQIIEMIRQFYPNVDILSAGGLLQLTLFGFVALLGAIAASQLVSAWSTDERERRLEVVAAAPITRLSWFSRSGAAVILALLLMGTVLGVITSLGAALAGDAALPVFTGSFVLGLYAAALAGVGILVAGLGWPQFAGAGVAVVAVGTYLLDLIGNVLRLPPEVLNLSLTRHLGQPMVGIYNWPGMAACLVLAVGGLAFGTLAFSRRDLR